MEASSNKPEDKSNRFSKKESVLYKKESFSHSHKESNSGIHPEYDVVDKHLIKKDNNVDNNSKTEIYGRQEQNSKINFESDIIKSETKDDKNKPITQGPQRTSGNKSNLPGLPNSENRKSTQKYMKKKSVPATASWEHALALELGMDENLMKKNKEQIKVKETKNLCDMPGLQNLYQDDPKKSAEFLKELMAAMKMKELTNKYGSKGKSAKEYFMETYDEETKQEILNSKEEIQDKSIKSHKHGLHQRKYDDEFDEFDDAGFKNDEKGEEMSLFGSPIAIRSIEVFPGQEDVPVGLRKPNFDEESESNNFWGSLERLQNLDEESRPTESLKTCSTDSYGSSWSSTNSEGQSNEEEESSGRESIPSDQDEYRHSLSDYDPSKLDKYLESGVQQVQQSEAVKRAWELVKRSLDQFDIKDPLAYDMYGSLYQEVRDFTKLPEEDVFEFEAGTWEPPLLPESEIYEMEPPEKLVGRFKVFQKALIYMAEHFELLRPILADIKQSYEEVIERCDKEWKDLDRMKLDQLKLRETFSNHVRVTDRVGDDTLKEVRVQAHVLQQHIHWQQHTLNTILGMLWKMRQSLKIQNHLVKKTKLTYKSKVEALAREIVNQQGQAMYEMTLPGKYTEIMDRFKQIKDPIEVRRILNTARRHLRKAHKQLVVFEADYADTIPRTEYELYLRKYTEVHTKNTTVIQKRDKLKEEIDKIKTNITQMKSLMYQEVGLDELTGEKPILYLEPLGINPNIPVYLRFSKPIVDLQYTMSEVGIIIHEIWSTRADIVNICRRVKKARDEEQEGIANYPDDLQYDMPEIIPFPIFFADFLRKKTENNEDNTMQLSYNVIATCRKNLDNPELYQFLGVLEGTVDESAYHLFQMELFRIKDIIIEKANESKDNKGYLGFGDFCKLLREIFPNKNEDQYQGLFGVARVFSGARGDWAMIPVTKFFEKGDASGKNNDFVDVLYQQFESERKVYTTEIHTELLLELGISEKLLESVDDPAWLTDVSMHIFYACITSIDPEITDEIMARYLAWVYLGLTLLPGIVTLGTRLVDFLKERAQASYDQEKYNEDDDMEFEDCIRQLKEYDEDDSTLDKLDMKKRRLRTKKLKFASLRQVTDRLFDGPFLRCGKRPVLNSINSEFSVMTLENEDENEHRHHHHHHHHHHGDSEGEHRSRRVKNSRRKKSKSKSISTIVPLE